MTTQWQRIVMLLLIFLLGIVAGSGLGYLYGKDTADTELQRELMEVQGRFETVNQNYLILVREYNKLFKASGPAVQTVAAVPAVESETYQVPASAESEAEAEASAMEGSTEAAETEEATESEAPAEATEAEETVGSAGSEEAGEATAEPAEEEAAAEEETEADEVEEASETNDSEEAEEATAEPAEEEATAEDEEEAEEEAAASSEDVAAPQAEFEAESIGGTGPLEGPPPQPFRFTDLSIGEIESWEWEFGDGETSTEQDPEHTYRRCPNDLCTVKLTVCGPGGCDTEVKEDYLWVSEGCSGC
jgi:hypothetical protein